jgi:hypothetical protein
VNISVKQEYGKKQNKKRKKKKAKWKKGTLVDEKKFFLFNSFSKFFLFPTMGRSFLFGTRGGKNFPSSCSGLQTAVTSLSFEMPPTRQTFLLFSISKKNRPYIYDKKMEGITPPHSHGRSVMLRCISFYPCPLRKSTFRIWSLERPLHRRRSCRVYPCCNHAMLR